MNKTTLLLAALACSTLCAENGSKSMLAQQTRQNQRETPASKEPYTAKDFSYLIGIPGFSDETLNMHFKLYEGYVKNTNLLLDILNNYMKEKKEDTPQFGAIKRRLAFEFDGMRLHELYFANLGGKGRDLDKNSSLFKRIEQDFGSFDAWKENFMKTGLIRGIGWVVLYLDPVQGRLMNIWVADHQDNHLAGCEPILIMDVWEHAYLLDYGLDRMGYIKAFWKNIDWDVVSSRYAKQS
ncbi:MAG: superoxide dismutase [Chlamydiales bacterium]|nr:superoxide dismutase [Chlamydiales bacterium]